MTRETRAELSAYRPSLRSPSRTAIASASVLGRHAHRSDVMRPRPRRRMPRASSSDSLAASSPAAGSWLPAVSIRAVTRSGSRSNTACPRRGQAEVWLRQFFSSGMFTGSWPSHGLFRWRQQGHGQPRTPSLSNSVRRDRSRVRSEPRSGPERPRSTARRPPWLAPPVPACTPGTRRDREARSGSARGHSAGRALRPVTSGARGRGLLAETVDERDQRMAENSALTTEIAERLQRLLAGLLREETLLCIELLLEAQARELEVVLRLTEPAPRLHAVLVLGHRSTPSASADASTPRGSLLRRANSSGV